jgi:DNA-binding CsgD family transcriptional regulator
LQVSRVISIDPAQTGALIDRIYEAAVVTPLWPDLLDRLGDAVKGNGGALFAVSGGYVHGTSSPRHGAAMELFMSGNWRARDQALPRAYALKHPGFVTEAELFTSDELSQDEVYSEFYRKRGLDYRAGTIIPMPVGDSVAITIFRNGKQGPMTPDVVAWLDTLRPHLARASMTASRIGLERALAKTAAMQAIGLPAAVLNQRGRLVTTNALFDGLVPTLFQDRLHRIAVVDLAADALLADALAAISMSQKACSIPVKGSGDRLPTILHLVPVRGAAHDVFAQSSVLLIATPINRVAVPTAEVLQGLFDLTPMEARIARGMAEAQSLEAIARAHGVSRETVRTQLKAVLAKTGSRRQSELVALLGGAAALGA